MAAVVALVACPGVSRRALPFLWGLISHATVKELRIQGLMREHVSLENVLSVARSRKVGECVQEVGYWNLDRREQRMSKSGAVCYFS